jgi:dTDP-glucose 4,6-dehydratase
MYAVYILLDYEPTVGGLLGMRALVTGGAGFIGSTLVDLLLSDNLKPITHEVTVLDSLTYAGNLKNLEQCMEKRNFRFIHGSINDFPLVESLIAETDIVINLAAETHVDRSIVSPVEFIETNINGTMMLLNAVKNNPKVRFLQVSTDEVYGSIHEGSWDEKSPLIPNSPYSASKASADLLCYSYFKTYNLNISITRCSNNFGPRQFPEKLIPVVIHKILNGEEIPVYGNGLNRREWIHVQDHARGIWSVATLGLPGEIYNIGSRNEYTNLEIVKKIISIMGADEKLVSFVKDRLGHDFRYSLNSEKIMRELDFSPLLDFDNGLKDTVEWYRTNLN